MRALEHRTRPPRLARRLALAPTVTPAPAAIPAPALGLTALELEDLLVAIGDLEDRAGTDQRARLARGRAALERELARTMTA